MYGPISCLIHANHTQALAWQQWVSRRQKTRHLPIVADWRDGVAVWSKLFDRFFELGRPDILSVFQSSVRLADTETARADLLVSRARNRDVEVLKFTFDAANARLKKNRAKRMLFADLPVPDAVAAE